MAWMPVSRRFLRRVAVCLIAVVILLGLPRLADSHGHSHDHEHHDHEHHHDHHDHPPAFKYSREANDPSSHHHHHHDHHHHDDDDHHNLHPDRSAAHSGEEARVREELARVSAARAGSSSTTGDWQTVWAKALGSTLLVSAAPFVLLFAIPLDASAERRPLLKVLLSFAAGGLLGDAFLHLIPHAQMAVESSAAPGGGHGHSHSASEPHVHDMSVGLWVLAGMVAFLMVEKFVRLVKGGDGHGHSHSLRSHTSDGGGDASAGASTNKSRASDAEKIARPERRRSIRQRKQHNSSSHCSDDADSASQEDSPADCHENITSSTARLARQNSTDASAGSSEISSADGEVKVAGYLNLAADFAHNFTDGLAIGSSYLAGHSIGVITTLTIILHEVPHEIGDYAILVQSGVSPRRAIMLQLLTAIGALTGTLVSLLVDGADISASAGILPFTAGGFIYIACVSVLPELLESSNSVWQSVRELAALIVGIHMMVVIAQYE